jgi:hypothetical protein
MELIMREKKKRRRFSIMENTKDRKSTLLVGAIALTLLMILSATFAWFSVNASVDNRLATQDGLANVRIQEVFVEPDDWKPGQNITKEVSAINTGDAPALVRVSFEELLEVSLPAEGEDFPFPEATRGADRRPVLVDPSMFDETDGWFVVTTTANDEMGGIKLDADYTRTIVFARYKEGSGSTRDSYEFMIFGNLAMGYQQTTCTRSWDSKTKTLSLSDIQYMVYPATISETVDWTDATPDATDIYSSRAEAAINEISGLEDCYPGYIKLNYENITTTPTADKWYYNAADGYFYFIGLVKGGTVTPNMLKSLLLDSDAGSDYYSNMVFELTVHLNAIQNTKNAVADQWSTILPNATLKGAIELLCES